MRSIGDSRGCAQARPDAHHNPSIASLQARRQGRPRASPAIGQSGRAHTLIALQLPWTTAIGFLLRAIVFYERHGIHVERVITDNGAPYRSTAHKIACAALGVGHLKTRPYRPAD